jgi:deoxyadenosine/deoxycytidine kinase
MVKSNNNILKEWSKYEENNEKFGESKIVSISGTISSGKTTLSTDLEWYFMNESKENISKKYPNLKCYAGKFKTVKEKFDDKIMDRYYDGLNFKKGLTPKDVSFDTQMYILSTRLKSNKIKLGLKNTLISEDRCFFEDCLFPKMQLKNKQITLNQYKIYMTFFKEFKDFIVVPKIWIYLKCSTKLVYANLQKRIKQRKENGFKTFGEEKITFEYMDQLNKVYDEWCTLMKKTYGNRFHVIELNENDPYPDLHNILKILNNSL